MKAETKLQVLLKNMTPKLNIGEFVFVTVSNLDFVDLHHIVFMFREPEGITVVIKKQIADSMNLEYNFVAAWITLMVHSSLEATGFTAVFSGALAKHAISCNVVSGYYHDHIFVNNKDKDMAMRVLKSLTINYGTGL